MLSERKRAGRLTEGGRELSRLGVVDSEVDSLPERTLLALPALAVCHRRACAGAEAAQLRLRRISRIGQVARGSPSRVRVRSAASSERNGRAACIGGNQDSSPANRTRPSSRVDTAHRCLVSFRLDATLLPGECGRNRVFRSRLVCTTGHRSDLASRPTPQSPAPLDAAAAIATSRLQPPLATINPFEQGEPMPGQPNLHQSDPYTSTEPLQPVVRPAGASTIESETLETSSPNHSFTGNFVSLTTRTVPVLPS